MGFPISTLLYTPLAGLRSRFCHWRFPFRLYFLRLCYNIYALIFVWHTPYCISYHITNLFTRLLILPNWGFLVINIYIRIWPVYNQIFVTCVLRPLGCISYHITILFTRLLILIGVSLL